MYHSNTKVYPKHALTRLQEDPSFQKYMILSSQQEVLRRRLSLQIPSSSPMTANSPELQSLASSPTSASSLCGYPVPTHPGVTHMNEDLRKCEDSKSLSEINQQIKATLTELLNTESVRSDDKFRAWVQERLMDAERQIRRQRRRHSDSDRDFAQSIAEHFDPRHTVFRISP